MKYWMGILLIVFFFGLSPSFVSANYNDGLNKSELLLKIELLQQQLVSLLEQQARLSRASTIDSRHIYKSDFYDGNYEALYYVDGRQLRRRDDTGVRLGDQLLWHAFVEMVGEDFIVKHDITEFRIFNDEDNWLSGFVDQKDDLSWVVAINRFGDDLVETYDLDFNVELLLHEAAHIVFFADQEYQEDFIDEFWSDRSAQRHIEDVAETKSDSKRDRLVEDLYEDNKDHFVTDYAATNPTEDLVETFVEFVISDYPNGQEVKDDKVRFFYQYPELVKWRQELQQSTLVQNAFRVS